MTIQKNNEANNIIEKAIAIAIELESDRLIKKAIKELECRVPEIIAGITVDLMQMCDFQVMQDRIVFTIKKKV